MYLKRDSTTKHFKLSLKTEASEYKKNSGLKTKH